MTRADRFRSGANGQSREPLGNRFGRFGPHTSEREGVGAAEDGNGNPTHSLSRGSAVEPARYFFRRRPRRGRGGDTPRRRLRQQLSARETDR